MAQRLDPLPFSYPEVANTPGLEWFRDCALVIDGTDVPISEPTGPFAEKTIWYSHKNNGYAVMLLVGIHMGTGQVILQHGPCPGSTGEITMVRQSGKRVFF